MVLVASTLRNPAVRLPQIQLRVRARMTFTFWRERRGDARRRDASDVIHLRVAATQQVPARRRAPEGCRLSELQRPMSLSHRIIKPESRQQNVKLFLREPLSSGPLLFERIRSWQTGHLSRNDDHPLVVARRFPRNL